ncbi:MAG: hypothetical protein D6704_05610 [Nitrospirae bacterium]|nr:MAG: hypothetical protein D6704_05610 [Nitrospirota bacterium]
MPVHIVVVSADQHLADQVSEPMPHRVRISVVRTIEELSQEVQTQSIQGVVVDPMNAAHMLQAVTQSVDLSRTAVVVGPPPVLQAAARLGEWLGNGRKTAAAQGGREWTLEDFVESKFEEFVRAMKLSAARSLYPTLIRAVERPLIKLALQETNGNQLQASQLLGINRNTLRKKMVELNISTKRQRSRNSVDPEDKP